MIDISTDRVNELCEEVGEMELDALASLCISELLDVAKRVASARDMYKGIADTYERSHKELREALGMSKDDDHEAVLHYVANMLDEHKRMKWELRSNPC